MDTDARSGGNGTPSDLRNYLARFKERAASPRRPRPYATQPIPCPMDKEIHALLRAFVAAGPSERHRAISDVALSTRDSQVLLCFGGRMAANAVRERNPRAVLAGLLAVTLEGERYDSRESTIAIALLHDAARRIDADASALFQEAALYGVTKASAKHLLAFLNREERDTQLRVFGYRTVSASDGFMYEPDPAVWGCVHEGD